MKTTIAVVVCTYRRNDPLRTLLRALGECAAAVRDRAEVAVVVVDDNPDRRAHEVIDELEPLAALHFSLGLHYRTSGKGNISLARNIACTAGAELAEWIAMTDDDCEPEPRWLAELLDVQAATGAAAVTGPCVLTPPPNAPRWLIDEPFLEDAQFRSTDRAPMDTAATNNSLLSAEWWRSHESIRFLPELGVLGGEDMVFYRTAAAHGLTIRFAANAIVRGHESPERATFAHQLRSRFWLGNTEYVTNYTLGEAGRTRLFLRGVKALGHALGRPAARLLRGRRPQLRYCAASVLRALGLMLGSTGLRLRHH